jgi:hypothetical protein
MAEPKDDPAHWQAVIGDLRTQLESRTGKIAELGAKKRQLSLGAMTGDDASKRRLGTINRELVELKVNIEDVEAAITAAEEQLVEAEAEAGRQAELAKRCKISDMCEKRIALAGEIDAAAAVLGGLLNQLAELHRALLLERPTDAHFGRVIDPVGRLRAAMVDVLPVLFSEGAPVRDPRRRRPLADLEREALAAFVLSAAGKERSAA